MTDASSMAQLVIVSPALASRIDGNVGMPRADYDGYYPWGDAEALASLLLRCRASLGALGPGETLMQRLAAQCRERAPLFAPARERTALRRLVADLLIQDRLVASSTPQS